jgi:phosphatidylserine/phosphatidylglycerophosphate/cardiolipin synthase-like enzyme
MTKNFGRKGLPRLFFQPKRSLASQGFVSVASFVLGLFLGSWLLPSFEMAPETVLRSDTSVMRACFSPGGKCTSLIVSAIDGAQQSIHVLAFSFTSPPIAHALIRAAGRGVDVQVLVDKSQLKERYSQLPPLLRHGVGVRIDGVSGLAHNKTMIFDGHTVLTGSFNFTRSGESRNAENILLIRNVSLARVYLNNWKKRALSSRAIVWPDTQAQTPQKPDALLKKSLKFVQR